MLHSPEQTQTMIESLQTRLAVEVCSLYLAEPAKQRLQLAASAGLNRSAIGAYLSYQQGLTGLCAREKKPIAVKMPAQHPDYFHIEGSGEERFQSFIGIPLVQNQGLFGVLVVQTERKKMFFHSEIKTLYQAGREVMQALQQAPGDQTLAAS